MNFTNEKTKKPAGITGFSAETNENQSSWFKFEASRIIRISTKTGRVSRIRWCPRNDLVNPSCTRSWGLPLVGGLHQRPRSNVRMTLSIWIWADVAECASERAFQPDGPRTEVAVACRRRQAQPAAAASSSPDPVRTVGGRPCAAVARAGAATDGIDSETIAARSPYQRPGAQRHRTRLWN